jgi:cell division protein FtsB
MKVIALSLLLAVVQAVLPVPREAPYNASTNRPSVQKDATADQKPTALTISSKNATESQTQQGQTEKPHDSHEQTTVIVQQPTSVWEKAYVVLTGLLAIIGMFGVAAAYRTLRAIESQVNAQNESLRARITIEFAENVFQSILHNGRAIVAAKFVNTGGTPAYRVIPETWIEFVSRFGDEVRDFTANAVHHVGNPVAVYPTTPTLFDIPLGRRASYDEIAGLRQATTTLAVRIRLTYDSLGKPYFVDRAFSACLTECDLIQGTTRQIKQIRTPPRIR